LNPKIYLSPPDIGHHERQWVGEALDANWIAPVGPDLAAFENACIEYTDCGHAVALSSGTAAIHLALRLSGVGVDDFVFTSTFTFIASANPILYERANPVFIGSESRSWNIDPNFLEDALKHYDNKGNLPKAILVVDLYGQSADMNPINELASRYDIPLIEDAAEALGASYADRKCGTQGRLGVYSFNGNKIITTGGGGMLVSQDAELIAQARQLATQARDPAPHYEHSQLGYNYRMSNILAAIGRAQFTTLDVKVEKRRALFQQYHERLSPLPGVSFMPEADFGKSTRWLTCMLLDPEHSKVTRDAILDALAKDNIEARPLWKPMHLQPLYKNCEYYGNGLSENLFKNGLCLPSGSAMTASDIDRVAGIIIKLYT